MKQYHEPIQVEAGDDGLPCKRIGRLAAAGAAPVAWHLVDRAWLEQVNILGDLGALRREMVDHILELQSAV